VSGSCNDAKELQDRVGEEDRLEADLKDVMVSDEQSMGHSSFLTLVTQTCTASVNGGLLLACHDAVPATQYCLRSQKVGDRAD